MIWTYHSDMSTLDVSVRSGLLKGWQMHLYLKKIVTVWLKLKMLMVKVKKSILSTRGSIAGISFHTYHTIFVGPGSMLPQHSLSPEPTACRVLMHSADSILDLPTAYQRLQLPWPSAFINTGQRHSVLLKPGNHFTNQWICLCLNFQQTWTLFICLTPGHLITSHHCPLKNEPVFAYPI